MLLHVKPSQCPLFFTSRIWHHFYYCVFLSFIQGHVAWPQIKQVVKSSLPQQHFPAAPRGSQGIPGSPACSQCSGLLPVGHAQENLQWKAPGKHPDQMIRPPQLAPCNAIEQPLPLNVCAPYLLCKGEPLYWGNSFQLFIFTTSFTTQNSWQQV